MDVIKYAREIFDIEIEELKKVRDKLGREIEKAVELIYQSKGKVVVTGIGKSGIIGKKIAATLASTGTLAIFMNSAEGVHGDLGMIDSEDIVLAISNSGNSDEVLSILPSIKKIGAKVIAMTGNGTSPLGKEADVVLDVRVDKEACPMNLAPTCSTTSTLVMGDALAAALIKIRNFKPENFALYHPGGSLGRRLLTKVSDIMHGNGELAIVGPDENMDTLIVEMTNKRLGAVCIVEEEKLVGIITEGDIRRALMNKERFFSYRAQDIMTKTFTSIGKDKLAMDAMAVMENRETQISVLPVVEGEKLLGMVRIHDLLLAVN